MVEQSLVRTQSPEEREYARYLSAVEVRQRRVAELETELAALTAALARFEVEFHTRISPLVIELDRVNLQIAEYEARIAWLHDDPYRDPSDLEAAIRAKFESKHRQIDDEEEDVRSYEQAGERERQRPKLDADEEVEAKRLYRELAKRYHPDLARSDEERAQREAIMAKVNEAFQERQLGRLQELAAQRDIHDPAFERQSIGEKLVWAIREIDRLDVLIARLEAELAAQRASDLAKLRDSNQIEAIEARLRSEIRQARDRHTELVATFYYLREEFSDDE